jgi:hypothetical protein
MPRQIDLFPQNLQVTNDPNNQISVTSAQINKLNAGIPAALAAAEQAFFNSVLTAIDNATGLDFVDWIADAQNLFNSISASLQQAWLNFQNLLNGIVQETDAEVTQVITYLNGIGEAANNAWTQLQNFFATGDWSDLTTAMQDILQSIFGSSTQWGLVNSIPAPAVVNVSQNIQPVFDFPNPASVSATGQWSWDGGHDHTGITGSGSAKAVCNGVLQALKGIPGAVQAGQVVTATAWVMWSGLAYTGSNPIQLQLIPYSQSGSELVAGTAFEVTQLASPASSGSWTELTGTYTVPSSGVNAVQLRLVVAGNASAGSVWWDDCEANVTGGYLAVLQNDLTTLQSNSTASTAAFATFLQAVQTAITGYTNWSTFITAVESAWNTYSTTESGLISADIFTIQQFFNTALGINTSSGQMASTNVSNSLGGSSLGADVQAILDYIANALGHSGTGHTLTQIETYLGLIPPANVTNVLGGANLGADVSSVHTTASNASSWSTRLTNDLLVLSDVFHLTYAAGTSTDAPGTIWSGGGTGNGKVTWYSCWNDLLALTGVVNSVTAPTDTAPTTGASITAAQASATTAGTNASIAISSASTANTTAQAITDGIYQSQNGGTSTGNPTSSIVPSLTAIPATNIVGGTGATVTFGAVGAGGWTDPLTTTATTSWTHTIATGDLGVLAVISYMSPGGAASSSSVTYGGTSMTLQKRVTSTLQSADGEYTTLEIWWLKTPGSGTQTVAVSVTGASGDAIYDLGGNTASYVASQIGTINFASGSGGTALSMSTSSVTGHMVLGAFAEAAVSACTMTYTTSGGQTQRYNKQGSGSGNAWGMVFGDAPGASSVSFGATSSVTCNWVGITVELEN